MNSMHSILVKTWKTIFAMLLVFACGCSSREQPDLSFSSFLSDLTNTLICSETPWGSAGLATSFDRTGGNQDWCKLTEPITNGMAKLVFLEGPGVVRRMWMTGFGKSQRLYFFFDGEKKPRIDSNCMDLFGKNYPFVPPLADNVSGGFYNYVPIPYSKSLLIASSIPQPTPRTYYQVNYERFPRGTELKSFSLDLTPSEQESIKNVRTRWRSCRESVKSTISSAERSNVTDILPGTNATVLDEKGPGLLSLLALRLHSPANISMRERFSLLRSVSLRIYWDGSTKPSVDVPLGDFFGNDFHRRQYTSLLLGNIDNTFFSQFPMPYRKKARIEIVNRSRQPINIEFFHKVKAISPKENKGINYFHASWSNAINPSTDYRIVHIKGQGHFVGCFLTVIGTDGLWNILEGDEKIYLDGEKDPSFHGTGLEDYFNGGWYYSGLFNLPLHGLVWKAPIRTSQYRFQLPDRIPFNKELVFDMEFGHGNTSRGYMSSVTYWYQNKPRPVAALPSPDLLRPPSDPLDQAAIMANLLELERTGYDREALNRCLEYIETYPRSPYAPMIQLRAMAYWEQLAGFNSVSNSYAQIAASATDPEVKHESQLLLWLHEPGNNALLTAHVNGKYRCYLDKTLVGYDSDSMSVQAYPLTMNPGRHELAIEVEPTGPVPWVNVAIRTRTINAALSDTEAWIYSFQEPDSWPNINPSSDKWSHIVNPHGILPTQQYWQFRPNAFIHTSSRNHFNHDLTSAQPYWSKEKAWFHLTFDIKENGIEFVAE